MARIRSYKPEFWSDEKLAPETPLTRLSFLGLIAHADDYGRLVDNVKQLDGMLFPETDDSCREALDILARNGRIIRYTSASGQRLIQITNWDRHQRVDKPSKAVLPPPPEELLEIARETREGFASDSRESRAPTMDHGPTINDQGSTTEDHGPTSSAREKTDPTPTESPAVHPECDRLCQLLASLIEANGSKRPSVTPSWLRDIDRMIRLDKREVEDIEGAIRWCQGNAFWRANILSPKKLREKFDTMRLQAQRQREGPGRTSAQSRFDAELTAFMSGEDAS